jgi:heme/copper-type cytochrome/quinol oxidase subunit 2
MRIRFLLLIAFGIIASLIGFLSDNKLMIMYILACLVFAAMVVKVVKFAARKKENGY